MSPVIGRVAEPSIASCFGRHQLHLFANEGFTEEDALGVILTTRKPLVRATSLPCETEDKQATKSDNLVISRLGEWV